MRTMTSLIIAVTLIGASAAIAQTTGTPNSGAGVQGTQAAIVTDICKRIRHLLALTAASVVLLPIVTR